MSLAKTTEGQSSVWNPPTPHPSAQHAAGMTGKGRPVLTYPPATSCDQQKVTCRRSGLRGNTFPDGKSGEQTFWSLFKFWKWKAPLLCLQRPR